MKLAVQANRQSIGWLTIDNDSGLYAFDYSADWLNQENRYPLSPLLPLAAEISTPEQHSAHVRQFFQNLLPEGQALEDAALANKVSKANLIGLLIALGQETAGALTISLADRSSLSQIESSTSKKRFLSQPELSGRICFRPNVGFSVWDGKVRLSIAGQQDKIAVFETHGHWYLVDGDLLASTHILKPDPIQSRLQGMTSNEFICMKLAKAVAIPVAETSLLWIPEPILQIKRFDRVIHADHIQRLHCIDGCQALGLGVSMKYERSYGDGRDVQHLRDGASLPKLFALLDQASAKPAVDRLTLLRWAIFQVLIGNTDAHGKNISFFIDAGGLRLAPAYDLVCCLLYAEDSIADTLAMAIGDNFKSMDLSAYDWALMAHECQLNPKWVSRELRQLASKILTVWPKLQLELRHSGADQRILDGIGGILFRQCERAQQIAAEIPSVSPNLL